jgi:hypothetical protein
MALGNVGGAEYHELSDRPLIPQLLSGGHATQCSSSSP